MMCARRCSRYAVTCTGSMSAIASPQAARSRASKYATTASFGEASVISTPPVDTVFTQFGGLSRLVPPNPAGFEVPCVYQFRHPGRAMPWVVLIGPGRAAWPASAPRSPPAPPVPGPGAPARDCRPPRAAAATLPAPRSGGRDRPRIHPTCPGPAGGHPRVRSAPQSTRRRRSPQCPPTPEARRTAWSVAGRREPLRLVLARQETLREIHALLKLRDPMLGLLELGDLTLQPLQSLGILGPQALGLLRRVHDPGHHSDAPEK